MHDLFPGYCDFSLISKDMDCRYAPARISMFLTIYNRAVLSAFGGIINSYTDITFVQSRRNKSWQQHPQQQNR
jgi:hypothetical protein